MHGKFFVARADRQHPPTVILLHGWHAEWGYVNLPKVAQLLLDLHVVAMIELPYHAHRKPGAGPGGVRNFISEDLARTVEAHSPVVRSQGKHMRAGPR